MSSPAVIFSHGQESGPWGTKIKRMAAAAREAGCEVDSIDYRGIADPGERVEKCVARCASITGPLVLVGSSMGGHVATAAASRLKPAGVFVLAPAYYMPGYEALTPLPPDCPLEIVHGWQDDVVPVENSIRYARECRAALHVLNGDHRLTANIDEIVALLLRFIASV
ncbi:MAG TPA: alpha/beta fold hydrolase [Woeseiaceae bacterium]